MSEGRGLRKPPKALILLMMTGLTDQSPRKNHAREQKQKLTQFNACIYLLRNACQ